MWGWHAKKYTNKGGSIKVKVNIQNFIHLYIFLQYIEDAGTITALSFLSINIVGPVH